jgi:K+-sensing histidine kinase KdpD
MAPSSSENVAVVILCRRDGTLVDLAYDELGLPAGTRFDNYVVPFDSRKAKRFVKTAAGKKAVLDRKLNVNTPAGTLPLYFSAAGSGATLVILGSRSQFESASSLPELPPEAARIRRAVRVAIGKLEALKLEREEKPERPRSRAATRVGPSHLLRLVAHDLTNPISGILAASQFLLEDAAHLLDANQSALLRSIQMSSQFALEFIDEILELQTMQSHRLRLRLQPADLGAVTAKCVEGLGARAEHRRIALECRVEGKLPTVDVDPQPFAQAITAIVRNELECLEPGGRVVVKVHPRNQMAEIAVSGEGAPRAASTSSKFGDSSRRTRPREGVNEIRTRLSLSAASRIVEAHRGWVRMEDRPADGPIITVVLPASAQPGPVRPRPRNRQSRKAVT